MLGESLKTNQTLRILDISKNEILAENLKPHQELTHGLGSGKSSMLARLYISSPKNEVQSHYLKQFVDARAVLKIYNFGKLLQDGYNNEE